MHILFGYNYSHKPLHALFRIKIAYHNYQAKRSASIHVPMVGPKLYIKLLIILVITYGITYPKMFTLMLMCLILPFLTILNNSIYKIMVISYVD